MTFIRTALISFIFAISTFLPSVLIPANADLMATADTLASTPTSLSVGSGSFILYATVTPTGANPAGTALTLTKTTAAQYFYVRNTGTLAVVKFTINITYDAGPGPVTIDRCYEQVSFSALNTCAIGTKTPVSISGGVITLTIPPYSWFAFELDPKKNVLPVISISVSSSQIRTPITTNS